MNYTNFTLLFCLVNALTAAESSVGGLERNLQEAFLEEIKINFTKMQYRESPQGWSSNPEVSLALFKLVQQQEQANLTKLESLDLRAICKILSANQKAYFQVAAVEHEVGVFDERSNFPTIIFFHAPAYPKTFAAWKELQKVRNRK